MTIANEHSNNSREHVSSTDRIADLEDLYMVQIYQRNMKTGEARTQLYPTCMAHTLTIMPVESMKGKSSYSIEHRDQCGHMLEIRQHSAGGTLSGILR